MTGGGASTPFGREPWQTAWTDYVLPRWRFGVHVLKTVQPYFDAVWLGAKPFEVRRDDRGFQPGDLLVLAEWTGETFAGRACMQEITYVLRDAEDFGLLPEFVVLGLTPFRESSSNFDPGTHRVGTTQKPDTSPPTPDRGSASLTAIRDVASFATACLLGALIFLGLLALGADQRCTNDPTLAMCDSATTQEDRR